MRLAGLASLSIATCILCFVACGGDEDTNVPAPGPDGSASGNTSSGNASSSGNGSSSGSSSSGDGGGDDDGGTTPDAGSDGGSDAGDVSKLPPSCRASNGAGPGINTCGATEAATDDCCKSLTLPLTKTRTLDKYEITAGRMRAFAEAVPNIRKFAKDFAAANPSSQLGKVATGFPAKGAFGPYLDTLPTKTSTDDPLDATLLLGAYPADLINDTDGCYITPGGYGASTYFQPPANIKPYGMGLGTDGQGKPDGTRILDKAQLDRKSLNCVSALMLATFCAWDGGELARTSDYREVWGIQKVVLPGTGGDTVFVPWDAIVPWSQFNWRNGHDGACPKGWPGCVTPATVFYSFPKPATPANDDAAEIAAPGRFPKDVTKAVSPDGGGWFDIGGNLMEQAWPNGTLVPATKDFCATNAGAGAGATACNRNQPGDPRPGTKLYSGDTPGIALVGYSFEVHARRSEKYLSSATDNEALIAAGDIKPAHFQYGKIGGRCVRVVK